MPIMHEGCQLLYDHYNVLFEKNEQKETDHIFLWNCGFSFFCSILILPLQTWSSSEILISFSVYLLVWLFAQYVYNTSAAWYFEWGERRGGMQKA